jgi:hypothetical protein
LTDVSGELIACIRAMGKVSCSESSVNIYQTARCNVPEDSNFHKEYLFGVASSGITSMPNFMKIRSAVLQLIYYMRMGDDIITVDDVIASDDVMMNHQSSQM